MKPRVYFLGTGNACRSQMAEGFARALGAGRIEVASAGLEPSSVNPDTVAVMAEAGVDISRQRSKAIDPELLERAAVVVTPCGEAEEACLATPPGVRRVHWPLPDPARARGSAAQRLAVFRQVRDELRERVEALLRREPGTGG